MTYLRIAVYYYSRMLRKNVDIHHNSPRILIVHYLRNQWTTIVGIGKNAPSFMIFTFLGIVIACNVGHAQ